MLRSSNIFLLVMRNQLGVSEEDGLEGMRWEAGKLEAIVAIMMEALPEVMIENVIQEHLEVKSVGFSDQLNTGSKTEGGTNILDSPGQTGSAKIVSVNPEINLKNKGRKARIRTSLRGQF